MSLAITIKKALRMEKVKILKILFWEYMQNLPVIAGFIAAYDRWMDSGYLLACLLVLSGSAAGATLIFLTEKKKQEGYREPLSVYAANILGMTIMMLAMILYFAASWGNWISDLGAGLVVGLGLGILQSLSARKRINWIHCIALGIASPMILVSIRLLLSTNWPLWGIILLVCFLATLIITVIDYLPDTLSSPQ